MKKLTTQQLKRKYPALQGENWREHTAAGDQIDAALDGVEYTARAHDIPVLRAILAKMAAANPPPFWVGEDPGYLPGIGISFENSSLAGDDDLSDFRREELKRVHDEGQFVASEAIMGAQSIQISTIDEWKFSASIGWPFLRLARKLLEPRYSHTCTVCVERGKPVGRAIGAVAHSAGRALRLITVCTRCRDDLTAEYLGLVDFFYPAQS